MFHKQDKIFPTLSFDIIPETEQEAPIVLDEVTCKVSPEYYRKLLHYHPV
jgi:hypothetical protein